ncbi:MAG: FAD-binding oxidoreductase [Chloroflexi bacterium]|nr:MAG: FAD-binding oxidoreductase [Chloroflexota bacterium]
MAPTANVVICGAGIAGIAAAYHLTVRQGVQEVLLVDERPPLTLTSDKSTEAYRNWWPGPDDAMVRLMNRSIDLLEALAHETGNAFHLNRRGYVYATADPDRARYLQQAAEQATRLGAGPLRYHRGRADDPPYLPASPHGFKGEPTGADLLLDPALIQTHFPYLSERTVALLHVRRCGWFSAQQMGIYLLEQARARGARFQQARVEEVELVGGRVRAVRLAGQDGTTTTVATSTFVNAAGPFLKIVGRMVGVDLPVFSERHAKLAFNDYLGVVPREAPFLIWADPQHLPWSEEERAFLAESEEGRRLLGEMPAGVHTRPEGGPGSTTLLMLWAYDTHPVEPTFPPAFDPLFPEIVLRGLTTMIPGLRAYWERMPRPVVDGGYYTKTRENRPLIGPLPVEGAYVIGALSGFGMMAACAAGELLATHVVGGTLPSYAPAFTLARYEDPAYLARWEQAGESWQL